MSTFLGTVRASSWSTLFDCSHRWYWQNVMNLRGSASGTSLLGNAIHAGTSAFDTARMNNRQISVIDAVDSAREYLINYKDEVTWDSRLNLKMADSLAVLLTTKYCQQIAPFRQYIAVELRFKPLDILTHSGIIQVTGTADRIRRLEDGRTGISDLKSGALATEMAEDGSRRAAIKEHYIQLGLYSIMAEKDLGIKMDGPGEIIGLQTSQEAYIGTSEVEDVKTHLLDDPDSGSPGLISIAAHTLKIGIFPPNPKSQLCSKQYCPAYNRCRYHN